MGIIAKHIGKSIGKSLVRVLTDISLEIKSGEFVSLTGRSGSGKSTLMYILSTLDNPTEGSIEISGKEITQMSSDDLYRFRNQKMGFVFQFNYLIAELSAIENVLLPSMKFNQKEARRVYAESLLEKFGLKEKMHRMPRQLSGGEQQRVAIARALVMEPKYLFADEPTGSLDTLNGKMVVDIIKEVNAVNKTTVVMVTHDQGFAALAGRQILLSDGKVIS